MLTKPCSATIAITVWLTVSLASANLTVDQDARIRALPSGPIPSPSTPFFGFSDSNGLQLPSASFSLSPLNNFTTRTQFHIPDSPIDLIFTTFGKPLALRALIVIVGLALDEISSIVTLHPTESITNGLFRQINQGVEIVIYQDEGKQLTWYLLDLLLLGIQSYASKHKRAREMRFDVRVEDQGKIGYGSLWRTDPGLSHVARRSVNMTSPQLSIVRIPKPMLTDQSNHSSASPILKDGSIIFSYHFSGRPISGGVMSLCFQHARERIRADVEHRPHDPIPHGMFDYRVEGSYLHISIEAYPGNQISWLLLDHILHDVKRELVDEHPLWECEFEFELDPFLETYGRGYLGYSSHAASDSL